MECEVCGKELTFRWTDTHGVGVCMNCGTPYTIFHYGENNKRLEKPPSIALEDSGIDIAKRFWSEKGSMVFPGAYDMGFLGGRSTTYSGATESDIRKFNEWYKDNE